MSLQSVVDNIPKLGRATPITNFLETRDAIIAMCMIKSGDFPYDWGASYTWPTGYKKIGTDVAASGSVTISGANIVDVLRSMTLGSKAWFYPHGTMKGSKAVGTPVVAAETYSLSTVPKETGVLNETAVLRIQAMHLQQEFWNTVRKASFGYNVFLFLNNMCIFIREDNTVQFHNIGVAVGGDTNNSVTGGDAQLSWQSDGELVWQEGVVQQHLNASNFAFTFAAITPTTFVLQNCSFGEIKVTAAASAGGSWTKPINEAAYSDCVTYSLEYKSGPGNTGFTVNASTGVVTVGTGLTAGVYRIRVIAQNNSSVFGFYEVIVTLT